MSDGKLMDTAPGGETSQRRSNGWSVKLLTFLSSSAPLKSASPKRKLTQASIADPETQVDSTTDQVSQEKSERGEKTAENIRYGEAISEHGMGGETTGNSGSANQDSGYGDTEAQLDEPGQSRKEQGYGKGSGVGG
ncbi:MAG: hypothetical protein M1827_004988 [Pycnora praestabilis]|nr:MAG: hypothetical protein M1827_004988 [Pycnora praestabilis]